MENRNLFSSTESQVVHPLKEVVAYEALWKRQNYSFKTLAELFLTCSFCLPSDLVSANETVEIQNFVIDKIKDKSIRSNVLINGTFDYPKKLRDAKYPVELLYYSGNTVLLKTRSVAVVGSRRPTDKGLARATKLVKLLVEDGFTIASGLAEGIDTIAHKTAIESGGNTIAVIGTPINEFYPRQNKDLQIEIARKHLLISQVPFLKYSMQDYRWNRMFFPERNKTMSALTDATIIVEASDTSGTLIQAKAAIEQGRKLFILQNCFENKDIKWPAKFEGLGAIRVIDYSDIQEVLNANEKNSND